MNGYVLDARRTQKLIYAASPEERAPLSFLCLAMFQQENCGEYIQQDDIEMAKTIFDSELVDRVVDKWFIADPEGNSWTCLCPVGIDTNQY